MPKNRQYYRKVKYPDKVTKPKCLVFVRIFLFCSVGIKIQYFPTAPFKFTYINILNYLPCIIGSVGSYVWFAGIGCSIASFSTGPLFVGSL